MFREHAYGRDDFVMGLNNAKENVYNFYKDNKDAPIIHDNLKDMKDVLSYSLQYQKGAWVLHMLRNYIGEDAFRQGIRNYYKKYFNLNTTTDQFKYEMEKVSNVDLDKFFDQWLYKGGMLIIDSDWKYNEKNSEIEISMDQVQDDGYLFDMPIEIMLTFENKSSKIESIQLDKKTKKFIISSENKPKEIKIDPSVKLLARWSINELK